MKLKRRIGLAIVAVWLWCAYVLFSTPIVHAEGGSATVPYYTRRWQGVGRIFKEVNCAATGDTDLVTAAEAAGALSIYFYNTAAATSAAVTLCPRPATGGNQCNDPTKGITLPINAGYTADVAVRDGAWSCDGTGGATVVEVYIEKAAAPNPTPTGIPTATPTPTPTPTPT
jgi:hypothetical protein